MATVNPTPERPGDRAADFARQAERRSTGLVREFFDFFRDNKKWWLIPVVVVLLLAGIFVVVGGSMLAPFIYALF